MAERVVLTVAPGSDPDGLASALRAEGATHVTPPRPEDPLVVVAEVPQADDDLLERVRSLPGVRSAERDQLRWTQSADDSAE